MRVGSREVIEALVAGRGPTAPALTQALAQWPGAHYWLDRDRTNLVLIRPLTKDQPARWLLHAVLLLLTIICSLGAGAVLAGSWSPWTADGAGLVSQTGHFFTGIVQGDWRVLLTGWSFALPLLTILAVHELGHYIAARRYAINTSPPYFLPIPPTLSPIGSLGAFIRLRSPVLDRRQLMDVGAAGPLAGFVVALIVLALGYLTSERIPLVPTGAPSYVVMSGTPAFLGDSLLTRALRDFLLPGTTAVHLSLPAFAGWVGMFVTGLNLLPLSQLDGGHVAYGVMGKRQWLLSMFVVAGLLVLSLQSPTWIAWVVMTFLIGGGRWAHPSVVIPDRVVPVSRRWLGVLCLVVFVLTFIPSPFLEPR